MSPLVALAAAAAVLGAALAGCDTQARGEILAEKLKASVVEKLGEVTALTCPERVTIQVPVTTFPCDVLLANGNRGTITVTLDAEGQLGWKTE